jgi:hypothetical protein
MKFNFYAFIILLFVLTNAANSQNIYYKNITPQSTHYFNDSLNTISCKVDSIVMPYEIKFAVKFYEGTQFKKITIKKGNSKNLFKVKSHFINLFLAPEKRKYTILIAYGFNTMVDSISLKHLSYNAKMAQLIRCAAYINDYSTSGFFDLFGNYFKNLSKKHKITHLKDLDLKVLEVGGGYQLLSLSYVYENYSNIESWNNPDAFSKYGKLTYSKFLSSETIKRYIKDLPVYVSKKYE